MKKLKLWQGKVNIWYREGNEYISSLYKLSSYIPRESEQDFDNFIFKQKLEFKSFSRGRSSAVAIFESYDKIPLECNMFLTDLSDCILQNENLTNLEGYFCFQKRGSNIGIKYLGKEVPNSNLEVKELNLESFKGV